MTALVLPVLAAASAGASAPMALAAAGGYGIGRARTAQENAILNTEQGHAAVRLAELGEAKTLLECNRPYWRKKEGRCAPFMNPEMRVVETWRVE